MRRWSIGCSRSSEPRIGRADFAASFSRMRVASCIVRRRPSRCSQRTCRGKRLKAPWTGRVAQVSGYLLIARRNRTDLDVTPARRGHRNLEERPLFRTIGGRRRDHCESAAPAQSRRAVDHSSTSSTWRSRNTRQSHSGPGEGVERRSRETISRGSTWACSKDAQGTTRESLETSAVPAVSHM